MHVLTYNIEWMMWNIMLAILPVGFAFLYFRTDKMLYKVLLAVLWFLFFPNALYVISDMEHIIWEWPMVSGPERILLLLQFAYLEITGLIAFICGMYAFEKELRHIVSRRKRKFVALSVITMNFLIGLAIVMGKIERVNSWDVFSATDRVIAAVLAVLSNDQTVLLAIFFGLFGNFFYFLFRDPIIGYVRSFVKSHFKANR